jgi:prophage DNA circulation protein
MSGFTNVTGFASGSIGSAFMGALQKAYWRGVPFSVTGEVTRKGRKVAIHDYPFRDGGWAEDMGRASRIFSFTGYLVGDIAPIMQMLLDNAAEAPGPGLLLHPTIGMQRVMLLSCSTAVRKEAMRVIECQFEFIEAGEPNFIMSLVATAIQVVSAATSGLTSFGGSIGSGAGPAATAGSAVIGEGVAVTRSFGSACTMAAADPGGLVSLATGINVPDPDASLGRYGFGNVSTMTTCDLDADGNPDLAQTVADMTGTIAAARTTLSQAVITATAAAALFSTATAAAMVTSLAAITEALRSTMTDPADQVRVFLGLSVWSYSDSVANAGLVGLPAYMATMRDAMAVTARRVALTSLAQASAAYRPVSYQDALSVREAVSEAIETEMLAAADSGDDAAYAALRLLRVAVVEDLTTRGATLPQVVTVTLPAPMPALTVAQRIYRDASRSDEVIAAAAVPHPAFLPTVLQVLAR